MMLTQVQFAAARRFVETQARSLEAARLHYIFDGAAADTVMAELVKFQNPDGGFGHGLEPDLRTPDSSVICTTIAFQIMRSLDIPPNHPVFVAGLEFLLAAYDDQIQHWPSIPPSAPESPHAPWWSGVEDEFGLNPTAEVLGYLYEGGDRVPEDLRHTTTERVQQAVLALDDIEMHDLLCCIRLVETPTLPQTVRQALMDKLLPLTQTAVDRTPAEWDDYGLRPLQVVNHPASPFMPGLEDAVAANLDYEIAEQTASGAWVPTWSWAEDFPEAWAQAQVEWSGVLTVDTLATLQRFGQIEIAQS